jgi:hypothetical protein
MAENETAGVFEAEREDVRIQLIVNDLAEETWREYENVKTGFLYRIYQPRWLYRKEGGHGHRVVDARGIVHWVPMTVDTVIRWQPKDPTRPVQF